LEGGAAWSADHPESGMIPRAVRDIFSHLQANVDSENSVRVSHLEVANEELVDLLAASDDKPLRLFEHPKDGVVIHNLESVPVNSVESIFKILRQSNARRSASATKLNASSSRSHCVFTITVQTKETAADGELIRVGRIHLIDLAGSENVSKAGSDKATAGGLNQSLLVLGRVIMALAEKRAHVPTRESKLTRLMADSLGGKHITAMIGCITQAASSYDETMATLEYALAAKKIKNKPEQNAKISKKVVIKEYLNEIEKLKAELRATREKNGVYMPAEEFKAMEDALKAARDRSTQLDGELSKKSKQLEDTSSVLSVTQERLRDTSNTLQATEADLSDTRAQLAETQSTLEQTQDALEETGEVVRAQNATEKVLHRNATGILKTLDVREAEVENLHGKIARKNAIEEENRAISSSFRQYVGTKVEDMSTQLKKFRSTQTEQFVAIKSTVHSFMEDKTKEIETLTEKLDSLQETLGAARGTDFRSRDDLFGRFGQRLARGGRDSVGRTQQGRRNAAVVHGCRQGSSGKVESAASGGARTGHRVGSEHCCGLANGSAGTGRFQRISLGRFGCAEAAARREHGGLQCLGGRASQGHCCRHQGSQGAH
jgi:kinesin family protein 11